MNLGKIFLAALIGRLKAASKPINYRRVSKCIYYWIEESIYPAIVLPIVLWINIPLINPELMRSIRPLIRRD